MPQEPNDIFGGATGMLKPGGDVMQILEQTFHDHMCSFTVQVHKADSRNSKYAFFIRILGAIPLGQRTYYFDRHGRMVEARTDNDIVRINRALTGGDVPK